MERVNRILKHPEFIDCMKQNEMAEADRCFCHHDMEHLCAVARIAMLLNLEEKAELAKDIIYGAAFLHDCGRFLQYNRGIPHDVAGVEIAERILPQCGYTTEEMECITTAIASHRNTSENSRKSVLADILFRADKMSRNCSFCKAYEECNWPEDLKNAEFLL